MTTGTDCNLVHPLPPHAQCTVADVIQAIAGGAIVFFIGLWLERFAAGG
ncbi:MAG: hypothetical protein QOK37_4713 [Thermoanaerobaculia bacterium]|jgi:hypothetical protein|nr:hypothetical protein [Thermoanaerobaculia bacterium]